MFFKEMPRLDVVKAATLTGHKDCIYTLEQGRKENYFFSAGGDGMVVAWNLENPENGELIAKVANSIYALHYIDYKDQILVGQNFEGLHLIDLKQKKEIQSAKITDSSIFDIKSAGNKIFVATGDGNLIVLGEDLSVILKVRVSEKSARCMAINNKKQQLAVGYSDHLIRVFDLKKFELVNTIPAHQNSIFTVAYSPDGEYLLSGSRDAHLKVWKTDEEYELKHSIVAHMYAINHIEYSPDGRYFATCSMDKSIKIWDAKEFKLLKVIDKARHAGHGTSINKLLWSSYRNEVVSCSDDRTISVWDLKFN
jgi:WD40 repeat protein